MWPPGTHGMLPSGSCTDAIASIVCATCAPVRMPATSGSDRDQPRLRFPHFAIVGGDLLAVHDDALAEHRVERALGDARPARVVLDQVAEEVVVALHRRGVGVVEPVRALEPPVRRVERVRVVRTAQEEAGALDLQLELVLAVDAHVPAGRVVVVVS